MKGNETQSRTSESGNIKLSVARNHGGEKYQKVFDARKHRLRGLWVSNGAFYGRYFNHTIGTEMFYSVQIIAASSDNHVGTAPFGKLHCWP